MDQRMKEGSEDTFVYRAAFLSASNVENAASHALLELPFASRDVGKSQHRRLLVRSSVAHGRHGHKHDVNRQKSTTTELSSLS